jgi:endonuclease YncB( thermonuclease family)
MGGGTLKTLGFVAVLIAALTSGSAHTAEISGVPTITDADTVVIDDMSIRLLGIDAPESDQICLDKNSEFVKCGIEANVQRL